MSLRIVIDTNVRISALINSIGACAQLLTKLEREGHIQLFSDMLLHELQRKLLMKFELSADAVSTVCDRLAASALYVKVVETLSVCRDPDDNRVLECALAGQADYIITGDKDLLSLHPWSGIQIITVRHFLDSHAVSGA